MTKDGRFEKGDWVKVWSLQSFHGGGFLNGVKGFVSQTQIGDSVLVAVERTIDGEVVVDKHYEVYAKQLELMEVAKSQSLWDVYQEIMNNKSVT